MVVGIDWYDNIDNEHSGARFYRSEIRESEALATHDEFFGEVQSQVSRM